MSDPVPNQLSGEAVPNVSTPGGAPAPGAPAAPAGGPGWAALPQPTPPPASGGSRRSGVAGFIFSTLGIRVIIIAVIAVGGLLVRDFVSGSASDIRVGDCIDVPTGGPQEVKDLQHHPCDQAHTGEVIAVFDYTGGSSATYPSDDQFSEVAAGRCVSEFLLYVGASFDAREDLDMTYLTPTQEGWGKGDREMTCIVMTIDGTALTTSVKAKR